MAALQNLVKIMSLYYQYMETYMGPALFAVGLCTCRLCVCVCVRVSLSLCMWLQITIEAMKSDIDEVALQGIEFWSNVCDEEMDLAIEASEVSPAPPRPKSKSIRWLTLTPSPHPLPGLRAGATPGAHQQVLRQGGAAVPGAHPDPDPHQAGSS